MEQTPLNPDPDKEFEKVNEESEFEIKNTLKTKPNDEDALFEEAPESGEYEKESMVEEPLTGEIVDDEEKVDAPKPAGRTFILHSHPEKEDFADALKQINKINWLTWATMGMFIIIMGIILFFTATSGQQSGQLNNVWSVGLIIFAIYMLVNGLVLNPKRLANKLATDPVLSAPGTTTIDENGLLDSKSTTGKSVPWSAFKDIFETDRSYLLMASAARGAYQVLAKRSFASTQEADEFRSFAAAHLPKASLRKAPLQVVPLVMFMVSVGMLIWLIYSRLTGR